MFAIGAGGIVSVDFAGDTRIGKIRPMVGVEARRILQAFLGHVEPRRT